MTTVTATDTFKVTPSRSTSKVEFQLRDVTNERTNERRSPVIHKPLRFETRTRAYRILHSSLEPRPLRGAGGERG